MDSKVLDRLLTLPDVIDKQANTDKKFVTKPVDVSILKGQQPEVFDNFLYKARNFTSSKSCIIGYAGTGKTFLVTKIIEQLLYEKGFKVCMTAPTNKAVKVLRDNSNFIDVNLSFATIHSLLGLEEKQMDNGEIKFVENKERGNMASGYDVIVVDEFSMLQDELLLGSQYVTGLFEIADYYDIHILFVGDPKQIPPVGASDSVVSLEPEKYNIEIWELTEIQRQAEGNPIIDVTMTIRKNLHRPNALLIRENSFNIETGEGVHFMDYKDKEAFNEILIHYFTSPNFQDSPDFTKVIAYTNKTVGLFNTKIRSKLFKTSPKHLEKLYVGEKLIANSSILEVVKDEKQILFPTNAEFVVESFSIASGDYDGAELHYYDTIVSFMDDGDVMGKKRIKVLHERSQGDVDMILQHYANLANEAPKGSFDARKSWGRFRELKKMFADINYNYAITAHKSQGSTYDNVFVAEDDIDIIKDYIYRNRVKYTACSRPRKNLFIFH